MNLGRRKQLLGWIESESISTGNIAAALKLAGVIPSEKAWQRFFDQLLLWLGTVAISVSLIFFTAYNWSEIGRLLKFGLVEGTMLVAIVAYLKFVDNPLISKASLLLATMSLGGLMALYSQTYQTGADPWQLFFYWSVLMLPWAMISQFSVLWLIWLTLINLSLLFYYQVSSGYVGYVFSKKGMTWLFSTLDTLNSEQDLLWLLFILNTIVLMCWEGLTGIFSWLSGRWPVRLIATVSGILITWLCVYTIFDDKAGALSALIWLAWIVMFYYVYRIKKQDLFMLAWVCLSGIVVMTNFFVRHMFHGVDHTDAILLLSIIVIGMGSAAAVWLKKVNKEYQS